jgi:hypothetical protein
MLEEANKPRSAVNWGACLTAAAVATSLVGATVARADDDDHWKKRRRHHHSPPSTSWRRPIRLTRRTARRSAA